MIIIVEFQLYDRMIIVLAVGKELCVFQIDGMWTQGEGSNSRGRMYTVGDRSKTLIFL